MSWQWAARGRAMDLALTVGCEVLKAWEELEDAQTERRVSSQAMLEISSVMVFIWGMKEKRVRNGFLVKDTLMTVSQ